LTLLKLTVNIPKLEVSPMKKFFLTLGLVGTLGTAAFTVSVIAQMNMDNMNMGAMGDSSTKALAELNGKAYDIAWLSQMIEHHRGAVTMSQMCLKTCADKDVKAAAQKIINAQDKEIKQMNTWLKSWYNTKADPKQMALMKADMKPMMDASAAGMTPMAGMKIQADRSFLEGMIPHHEHAVAMGKDAANRALRPELRKFGQNVVNDQGKEIKQFQGWLKTKKI
jgi:uncharacterized protein (DUF305 family)